MFTNIYMVYLSAMAAFRFYKKRRISDKIKVNFERQAELKQELDSLFDELNEMLKEEVA